MELQPSPISCGLCVLCFSPYGPVPSVLCPCPACNNVSCHRAEGCCTVPQLPSLLSPPEPTGVALVTQMWPPPSTHFLLSAQPLWVFRSGSGVAPGHCLWVSYLHALQITGQVYRTPRIPAQDWGIPSLSTECLCPLYNFSKLYHVFQEAFQLDEFSLLSGFWIPPILSRGLLWHTQPALAYSWQLTCRQPLPLPT